MGRMGVQSVSLVGRRDTNETLSPPTHHWWIQGGIRDKYTSRGAWSRCKFTRYLYSLHTFTYVFTYVYLHVYVYAENEQTFMVERNLC